MDRVTNKTEMRGLLYVVAMLFLTACSVAESHPLRLDEAQSLLETKPKQAFEMLSAMDLAEFQDSATMAHWALLYSEAMVRNRLSAPTDTIVNIAVDYYGQHNQIDELKKAQELKRQLRSGLNEDALVSALYIQKVKEFQLYKERAKREQYLFVGLIVLLIAAGVIVWQRQRLKLSDARNEALMAEASGLRDSVDSQRDVLSEMLSARFATIDALCESYYESQGMKNERKAIIDKVKSQIEGLQNDKAVFAEMEQTVNSCRGGMLDALRTAYPDLKPDDYRLFVYLACGLSNRTIALLLDEKIETVYKRKSRLKAKLSPEFQSVF